RARRRRPAVVALRLAVPTVATSGRVLAMPDKSPLAKREPIPAPPVPTMGGGPAYAELRCRTNFSFLRGASHADELVGRAAELGYTALAVTDRNSLAGAVRAHVAAKEAGLPLIVGAE